MKKKFELNTCDFCYGFHLDSFKTEDGFNVYEKVELKKCLCCNASMCKSCVEHSQEKTENTPFSELGMVLCGSCILQHRDKGEFKKYVLQCYLEQKQIMQENVIALCSNYFKKGMSLTLPLLTLSDLTLLRKEKTQSVLLKNTKGQLRTLSSSILMLDIQAT